MGDTSLFNSNVYSIAFEYIQIKISKVEIKEELLYSLELLHHNIVYNCC